MNDCHSWWVIGCEVNGIVRHGIWEPGPLHKGEKPERAPYTQYFYPCEQYKLPWQHTGLKEKHRESLGGGEVRFYYLEGGPWPPISCSLLEGCPPSLFQFPLSTLAPAESSSVPDKFFWHFWWPSAIVGKAQRGGRRVVRTSWKYSNYMQ